MEAAGADGWRGGVWVGSIGSGVSGLAVAGAGTNVGSAAWAAALVQAVTKTESTGQLHQNRKLFFRNPGMDFRHAKLPPATASARI